MKFPFFIAKRFSSSKRKNNFVQVISRISLIGVGIGTAALILVLSVFNGFEELVLSMYNSFDPHLKITSAKGKTFNPDSIQYNLIQNQEIDLSVFVLEEKALLKHKGKEYVATLKGVSKNYKQLTHLDSLLIDGNYITEYNNQNVAIIGSGVAYYLSISVGSIFEPLQVFLPNRKSTTLLNPVNAFKQSALLPVGVFRLQAEIDQEYIITNLGFIQELADKKNQISAVEIKLKDIDNTLEIQQSLQNILGEEYIVQNRLEQQVLLYKILNTERAAIFLILIFIMIIAAFNIIGSLSMLILDKKEDILSLRSFGTSERQVHQIFFTTSMINILYGAIIGVLIGGALALLQQSFGFVGMGEGNFIIDSYPVSFSAVDFCIVLITVAIIGVFASWYPSKILTNRIFRK